MFCTKVRTQLKQLLRQFDNYVDEHVDTALKITTELKTLLSSPAADVIAAIIPGNIAAEIQQQLLNALGKAIAALTIADDCKKYTDINDQLKCFIQQLQLTEPDIQDAILQKLASLITGNLDGARFKQSLYDLYTQAKYSASK